VSVDRQHPTATTTPGPGAAGGYALGESPAEQARLRAQADRLRRLTGRFLCDIGLAPGMRVLELGAGLGDFTALVGQIVGAAGQVIAIDRSPVMLEQACRTVSQLGLVGRVRFVEADLDDLRLNLDGPFDALVGRLVLTHVADPVATLRRAIRHVREAGIVAFQEADATLSDYLLHLNRHELPLTWQVCEWIKLARRGTSMNEHLGLELCHVFQQAGLSTPTVHLHTEVYAGPRPERIGNTVRMLRELMPRLAQLGVPAAEVAIDTLEQRLAAELESSNVVQALTSIASAWTAR
jgi:ubiquinone/menaquinone biosynthesis C-methylase UbiE